MSGTRHTVVVTGAAGSVGRGVLGALLERRDVTEVRALELPTARARRALAPFRPQVRVVWGDVRDHRTAVAAVEGATAVVHLAALIPPAADRRPALAESVNVGGTRTMVEAVRAAAPRARLIHASSISVYGDRLDRPWIEVGDPLAPSPGDAYGETKVEAERIVRRSGLWWSIFRLTGVMGPGMGLDPLMFHMPLETRVEVVSRRDCGRAFARAIDVAPLEGRVFDLGGGARCRTTYRELLDEVLDRAGLGRGFFPAEAFAQGSFHCGWYRDSPELEALLGFQRDGLGDVYDQLARGLPRTQVAAARLLRPVARAALLWLSEPYRARRSGDSAACARFCLRPAAPRP